MAWPSCSDRPGPRIPYSTLARFPTFTWTAPEAFSTKAGPTWPLSHQLLPIFPQGSGRPLWTLLLPHGSSLSTWFLPLPGSPMVPAYCSLYRGPGEAGVSAVKHTTPGLSCFS